MEINGKFDERVVVHAPQVDWHPSPMKGVDRKPLDRLGDEVARATSIVRYAKGSRFSEHVHDGGEEFIVLSGVFQDEHGDYPAGSYVRNPPGTRHSPYSKEGCELFVKLWQFDPSDKKSINLNMNDVEAEPDGLRAGVSVVPLFENNFEDVRLEIWEPHSKTYFFAQAGAELLVLEGELYEGGDMLKAGSWLRLPPNYEAKVLSGASGAKVWIKTGHLRNIRRPNTG
ncbi:cupin [Rhodobacteraceae bacterium RKSG542]|uniref:cupin domain-containing protein n=1 Tax=Pseudovibrio flavus TaxID=2529854 RepID=UPI0012BC5A59|nr:cupin domain-containing protein [Pseudovibrio flavus]MTI16636.1 cupin [Pseudovibrio flavus]